MGLGTRPGKWRRALQVILSDEPAARAAPEVVFVTQGQTPGFVRTFREGEQIYRRFQIEMTRHAGYRDDWIAFEESPIIERGFKKLAEDATAQFFDIECDDRRAKEGLWEMLTRIRYWHLRAQLLTRFMATGDLFLLTDLNVLPRRKRNMAEITGIRIAPEFQMFRLENERGVIPNPQKAFMQMPAIDWRVNENGDTLVVGNGETVLMGGGGWYKGLVGASAERSFYAYRDETIFFPAEQVVHARLNPWLKPIMDGYGCSGQRTCRVTHNVVQMGLQDMAVERHHSTFRREHHSLPENTSTEAFDAYQTAVTQQQVGPLSRYFTKDGKIEVLDNSNSRLQELGDLRLSIQMVMLAIGYPLALVGFMAEEMTGEILDRLEQPLNATLRGVNNQEEYGILRPLCDRELWYMGKAGTPYEIKWPNSPRPEDQNKLSKRVISEVQTGIRSRQSAMRELYQFEDPQCAEMLTEIEGEMKRIGEPGHYTPPAESLDKGKKGVEKKPAATQDIADHYRTGGR